MKAVFIHDHIFQRYKNQHYSNGKLNYAKLAYYLNYFDCLDVVGRYKIVDCQPLESSRSDGECIEVTSVENLSTLKGFFQKNKIYSKLLEKISEADFVIARLPSELGSMANRICLKLGKPILNEVVADPFECLWYRGDISAKLYSLLAKIKLRKVLKKSLWTTYVTKKYLQDRYPSLGRTIALSDVIIKDTEKAKELSDKRVYKIGVIANPTLKIKGVINLINAVRSSKLGLIISIVGGGKDSDYEKEISKLEFVEQVGYLNSEEDMNDWFKTLDVYVQPSLTEGLPRSIIEAMSFGLPCLGSNVGGIPELLPSDMVFNPKNTDRLRELIDEVLLDSDLYIKHSNYCLNKSKEYLFSTINLKKEKFYKDFISSSY